MHVSKYFFFSKFLLIKKVRLLGGKRLSRGMCRHLHSKDVESFWNTTVILRVYCSLKRVTKRSGDPGCLYTDTEPRRRIGMDKLIWVFQFSYLQTPSIKVSGCRKFNNTVLSESLLFFVRTRIRSITSIANNNRFCNAGFRRQNSPSTTHVNSHLQKLACLCHYTNLAYKFYFTFSKQIQINKYKSIL